MELVFDYAKNSAITSEAKYPYKSGMSGTHHDCRFQGGPPTNLVKKYFTVTIGNEDELKSLLVNYGPVVSYSKILIQ